MLENDKMNGYINNNYLLDIRELKFLPFIFCHNIFSEIGRLELNIYILLLATMYLARIYNF